MTGYIICMMGPQGSGKDVFADAFVKYNPARNARVSIADGIRKKSWEKYHSQIKDKIHLWGDFKDKERTIDDSWLMSPSICKYFEVPENTPWTGRYLLQYEGTVCGTDVYEDVWTELILSSLQSNTPNLVVTDARRPSQMEYIRENSYGRTVLVVEVVRQGSLFSRDTHETERLFSELKSDVVLSNFGSLEEFQESIDDFILRRLGGLCS